MFRTATIWSGLQVRCKALIECGWTWGEMGKEGLKALEMFEAPNGNGTSVCASARRLLSSSASAPLCSANKRACHE